MIEFRLQQIHILFIATSSCKSPFGGKGAYFTLFIMISAPGLTRSFNHDGAIPIAKIPTTNMIAAAFSFHVASIKVAYSAFNGPIAVLLIALKIYTAVTTMDIQA